jgi:uncharacterized protein YdeI (YjbR/CyaY-like superfamily)
MEITRTFYASDRKTWRNWLAEHHKTEKEIWLIYYRKQSGKERISYNDAVEEALCFGWIDSTVKKMDSERIAQRFTPRNPRSEYSQTNKERLRWLVEGGQVLPEVLASLGDILTEDFDIPADILQALQEDEQAWNNFQKFPGTYQRIRVAYVDGVRKRPGEFEKRLRHLIEMTAKNKKFGYGIEKFY